MWFVWEGQEGPEVGFPELTLVAHDEAHCKVAQLRAKNALTNQPQPDGPARISYQNPTPAMAKMSAAFRVGKHTGN